MTTGWLKAKAPPVVYNFHYFCGLTFPLSKNSTTQMCGVSHIFPALASVLYPLM